MADEPLRLAPYVGGSFAPPLSDELLAKYKDLTNGASPQIKDAMTTLLHCCNVWWELPESALPGVPHRSGMGVMVPLEGGHKAALDDHIPWNEEIEMFKGLFDKIDNETHKPLRNAAFHLLWHVIELNLDREPITTDKL